MTKEEIKIIATDFFIWWYNAPGNNTYQGFDEWWEKIGKKEYGDKIK